MKKRIHTIDGKILVQGGTDNELKSNEIRVNADKTLTERVNGEVVSAGGSSTVDNPDDYEKQYTMIGTNANGEVKQGTLTQAGGYELLDLLAEFTPVKIEIICEYLKNGTPIKFVPSDFKILQKMYEFDPYNGSTSISIKNNTIVLDFENVTWCGGMTQLYFYINDEKIFNAYIQTV